MKSIKILKTITVIVLVSLYGCKKEKETVIIPETKTNMPIVRGNYDISNYRYKESTEIEEWQPTLPHSIFLEEKQPDFKIKVDSLQNFELQNSTAIHQGFINRTEGSHIYNKQSFDSKIVSTLPQGALVHIVDISNTFKQYKTQKDKLLNGKWVKVEYKTPDNNILSGYILDEFINYHIDTKPLVTISDTITVKNEAEFLEALSSNRLIEVATDTLNFETYFKSINKEGINTQDDVKQINHETYYTTSYGYEYDAELLALGLYGYDNLIIRGKNRTVAFVVNDEISDVLTINNCQNIVLENLNFYHNVSTSCEGDVVIILKSNNLLFNNTYFNGSGQIGTYIKDSNYIDFKNCHFFNNNISGISCTASQNINVQNSAFYNNDLYSIIFSEIKENPEEEEEEEDYYYDYENTITLKNVTITNNYIHDAVFYLEVLKLDCFETVIENNGTSGLINSDNETNFNFVNSRFTKNSGRYGDYIIANNGSKIFIKNSEIKTNQNYYEFINNSANYQKDILTVTNNIFNQKLDSIPSSENSIIINNKAYIIREKDNLLKNENNQLKTKLDYKLNGFQALKFETQYAKTNKFLGLDLSFINNVYRIFKYGYGECKQGKPEGPWRFTTNNREDFILDANYVNGTANGDIKIYGFGNNLIIEGQVINNKKIGTWHFYNQEGIITKTLNYKNDKEIGPFITYYPNGNKREVRSHINVDKGIISNYYPNGKQLCHMVFNDDASVNIEKTKFFDNKGKQLDVIKSKTVTNSAKSDIVSNLPKKSLRNKVVILESSKNTNKPEFSNQFIGFYQTNNKGEKHGFSKIFYMILNQEDDQSFIRTPNANTIFSQYNNSARLKTDIYEVNGDKLFSITIDEKGSGIVNTYKGWFESLSSKTSIFMDSNYTITKTGLYQEYNNYNVLIKEGMYKDNEKVEGTWKTYNGN